MPPLMMGLPILLIFWLLAFPLLAALRHRPALTFGAAAGFAGLGLLLSAVLTLPLTFALEGLMAAFPALNPVPTPAFEPVDAGLFALWLGLTLALVLAYLAQARLIHTRIRRASQQAAS